MGRPRLSDVLQDHFFWAFDASDAGGVPIFNPLFGFSRISAPEIGLEIESFKDGTFLYNRGVIKGGTVSPVLFERAASMFDADFYDWIIFTLHGNKDFEEGGTLGKIANFLQGGGRTTPRRNLLIVQFTGINMNTATVGSDPLLAATAAAGISAAFGSSINTALAAGAIAGGSAAFGVGPFEFAMRVPARGWLLHGCLPVRYRAGNDFDAASGQVSLMELEVQPEYIEEFSLGVKP